MLGFFYMFGLRFEQFSQAIKYLNMKSKIMIGIGHDYKPVIKVTRENSEDVRDELVDSFFREWGFQTNLLFMAYHSHPGSQGREYTIATMPDDKRFKVFGEEMLTAIGEDVADRKKVMDFFQWFGHRIGYEKNSNTKPEVADKNGFPRRNRLDLNTPAELAIYNAIQEVEKLPADNKLTNAVNKLSEAKDLVADFIDEQNGNQKEINHVVKA